MGKKLSKENFIPANYSIQWEDKKIKKVTTLNGLNKFLAVYHKDSSSNIIEFGLLSSPTPYYLLWDGKYMRIRPPTYVKGVVKDIITLFWIIVCTRGGCDVIVDYTKFGVYSDTDLQNMGDIFYSFPNNKIYASMKLQTGNVNFMFAINPSTDLCYPVINPNVNYIDPNSTWVTTTEIINCCTSNSSTPGLNTYCGPDYLPGGEGSICPFVMENYCKDNWLKSNSTNEQCQLYLQNYLNLGGDAQKVVQNTIIDNLNSLSPPDYTSKLLNSQNKRDDSSNSFFTTVIPDLCGYVPGACDCILSQYCSSFTKDDLNKDPTLQQLCGCFLNSGNNLPCKSGINLTNISIAPNQYEYSFAGIQCDPYCRYKNTIQNSSLGGECSSTVCIIDNININDINSSGSNSFNIACGDGKNSECYIGNIDINKINSQGQININENCGSCFVINSVNPLNVTNVKCSDLSGGNGKDSFLTKILNWIKSHIIIVITIILILIIILFFIIFKNIKK